MRAKPLGTGAPAGEALINEPGGFQSGSIVIGLAFPAAVGKH
jgi:hypothetical protein